MEKDKMHILRLLTAIGENGSVSQRELSGRLNVSLGLINLFIKRLINHGYFDVMIRPSKKTIYALTPKGVSERTRLALEYFDHSLEYYRGIRNHIRSKLNELENEQVKIIILYGMGELAELTYICMQDSPVNLLGVIDSGPTEQKTFSGTGCLLLPPFTAPEILSFLIITGALKIILKPLSKSTRNNLNGSTDSTAPISRRSFTAIWMQPAPYLIRG